MDDTPEKPYWRHEKTFSKQETVTITLWPYRSLGSSGFLFLMGGFIGLTFILSLLFYTLGAWPVIGFLGIEIGLVWLVFRMNYNAGGNFEQISITPNETLVEKVNWRGEKCQFNISSPWVTARCIATNGKSDKLVLNFHSEQLEIGSFLPPREKHSLADALNDSFNRMRGAT